MKTKVFPIRAGAKRATSRRVLRPGRTGTHTGTQSQDDRIRHTRALACARQRKKRKLSHGGFERVTIRYSEAVITALYLQAIDAKMGDEAATAASTDKAQIAEGLANVIEHWAQWYLKKRRDGA